MAKFTIKVYYLVTIVYHLILTTTLGSRFVCAFYRWENRLRLHNLPIADQILTYVGLVSRNEL